MPLKQTLRAAGLRILQFCSAYVPRSRRVRRILLDPRSALAASYLEDLREVFADDPRLQFFKFIRPTTPAADRDRCLIPINCPEISYRTSKFYPWDLIVMADHPEKELEHRARFGFLRIPHGVGSKMVDGHDYLYGPRLYGLDGRLRYSGIFEASEGRRTHFVAANAELKNVVRLVGD